MKQMKLELCWVNIPSIYGIGLPLKNRPEDILSTGIIHFAISVDSLTYVSRKFKWRKYSFSVDEFGKDILQIPWDTVFFFVDFNAFWFCGNHFTFKHSITTHHFVINELSQIHVPYTLRCY